MAASESQYAANRLNALKSCGPKTVEGKQKTRLNGMVHGLASTVLSTEDAQAFEERMDEVAKSMRPRNALEKLILANSVRASWMIDRTARVQTARLDSLIDGEPARAIEQIFSLGKRLFFNAQGPIYGVGRYQYIGDRTSWSGVADHPDDPDTLVRQISSSVLGCLWLLDRFSELRALLEPGKIWNSQHKFMAIRLLGKQPLDCYTDIQIAEICLRMWTTNPARDNAWIDMRSELGRDEYARFRDTILRQWPQLLDSLDDETERQILRAIVDQAVEQVKVKAAMAAERAERDGARRADCLAFDDSPGRRAAQGATSWVGHRAFLRSVEAFSKARRDSENDDGDPPESEVGNSEERTPPPHSFPPLLKGGFGGLVVAPPVSNAPGEGGGSEGWSLRDEAAWLPEDAAAGPVVSEPIDSSLTADSRTTIGDDLVIDRISSSSTIDSSVTTAGSTTIDSASSASMAAGPTITSLDARNLQTEPNFRPEREPNHPGLAQARYQPDDPGVPGAELGRHDADAAGDQEDPNRRLISATVLGVSAVLLLYGCSLLSAAVRRTPRAQGEVSRGAAASSPTPTRRASFDFAPSVRRPEGAVTNQPRATPWEHVQQPIPSPDGAKQNSVFHGRHGTSR